MLEIDKSMRSLITLPLKRTVALLSLVAALGYGLPVTASPRGGPDPFGIEMPASACDYPRVLNLIYPRFETAVTSPSGGTRSVELLDLAARAWRQDGGTIVIEAVMDVVEARTGHRDWSRERAGNAAAYLLSLGIPRRALDVIDRRADSMVVPNIEATAHDQANRLVSVRVPRWGRTCQRAREVMLTRWYIRNCAQASEGGLCARALEQLPELRFLDQR